MGEGCTEKKCCFSLFLPHPIHIIIPNFLNNEDNDKGHIPKIPKSDDNVEKLRENVKNLTL